MHAAPGSEAARNQTTMNLEGDRTIVISRTFNAPPRIVFDAWTRADLVRQWWAPKNHGSIISCEADVRVGGHYRYAMAASSSGEPVVFLGTYKELTPHSRIVFTQVFEPMADAGHAVITITLEDVGGKTRFVSREVYPSAEVRDVVVASGMEGGMRETMDQLDALVATLR